jgi:N-acetylglucosaminyl-diphospho-decaprenol L-rhamnosyltransferase
VGQARAHGGRGDGQREDVDCGIVVVSFNSADHIGHLLDSVPAAAQGLRVRCVVVDNDSRDATRAILGRRAEVTLIESESNLGYSGAINIGRGEALPCSCLLIVNPDLVLESGAIVELCNALHERSVGVAVPMVLDKDDRLFPTLRREPTVLRALGEALFGDRFPRRPGWLSESVRDPGSYREPRDVEWAGGAVMCVSSECHAAVGDWDEGRFFLYSEETDFAARARRHGFGIRYVPAARVRHEDGGSGRPSILDALASVNRVRYYEKYHGPPASWLFRSAVALKHILRCWDPGDRLALRYVCRRSGWADLPGGRVG